MNVAPNGFGHTHSLQHLAGHLGVAFFSPFPLAGVDLALQQPWKGLGDNSRYPFFVSIETHYF